MRLKDTFVRCGEKGEAALLGYLCAGDPDYAGSLEAFRALAAGGCDILELGLPHSDPIADGPTIQAAGERALSAGMNTDIYFKMATELNGALNGKLPLVCMSYYNPVLQRGLGRFTSECAGAGISGLIVPDLPPEESGQLRSECDSAGVDLVFMVAPTTTPDRARELVASGGGFTYIVSRLGVTGAAGELSGKTMEILELVPRGLPRVVGFGVSKPGHVRSLVQSGADGVIVGSAFVEMVGGASGEELQRIEELAGRMKEATRL